MIIGLGTPKLGLVTDSTDDGVTMPLGKAVFSGDQEKSHQHPLTHAWKVN
jgi:hypothetical protein